MMKSTGLQFENTKWVIKAVNRRRTDNIMVKIKITQEQTMIYKTLHRKLKIEQHEPH